MARDWCRAVLAASAAAVLGGACVLGAHAQAPAADEPEERQAPDAQPRPSAKRKQDPADAQRAIEASMKHLQAGRADHAVQALSATLAGGNLPPAVMAKAFYVRGMAYRQQRKPAQAISDLTSALWLKGGLGGDERADAVRERTAAYADAGLSEGGNVARPAPSKGASGNWLSGLFSSPAPSTPPASQASVAATPDRVNVPAAKPPAAVPDGWTNNTQVQPNRPALAAAPAARPSRAETPPPSTRMEGGYLVQLAAVRTEAEALALAAKAKREQAALLAAREQRIDRAVLGNMGAFYRVRFGPFANAQETQTVCARLQGSGFDCMPVGP